MPRRLGLRTLASAARAVVVPVSVELGEPVTGPGSVTLPHGGVPKGAKGVERRRYKTLAAAEADSPYGTLAEEVYDMGTENPFTIEGLEGGVPAHFRDFPYADL